MNKLLKTILTIALLAMPVTSYAVTARPSGDGGSDNEKVLGIVVIALIAAIFGFGGGSLGGDGSAGNNGSAGN